MINNFSYHFNEDCSKTFHYDNTCIKSSSGIAYFYRPQATASTGSVNDLRSNIEMFAVGSNAIEIKLKVSINCALTTIGSKGSTAMKMESFLRPLTFAFVVSMFRWYHLYISCLFFSNFSLKFSNNNLVSMPFQF